LSRIYDYYHDNDDHDNNYHDNDNDYHDNYHPKPRDSPRNLEAGKERAIMHENMPIQWWLP